MRRTFLSMLSWALVLVAAPLGAQPMVPQPPEELYSKPLMVTGFIVFPIGGVISSAGSFVWLTGASTECECVVGAVCDCGDSQERLGLGLWVGGGMAMVGGIVMAIVGSRADETEHVALPELTVAPRAASLRWRF
jgi:hypothetical protein